MQEVTSFWDKYVRNMKFCFTQNNHLRCYIVFAIISCTMCKSIVFQTEVMNP